MMIHGAAEEERRHLSALILIIHVYHGDGASLLCH